VVWMGSDQLKPIKNKDGKDITAMGEPAAIWRAAMEAYASPQPPEPAARTVPTTR
jgi:membrane peptidoglycan carboxypeptidase